MVEYEELIRAIRETSAEIFSMASTEEEVCELEQQIYEVVNRIAAEGIAELT